MELPAVMATLQLQDSKSEEDSSSPKSAAKVEPETEAVAPRILRKRLGVPILNSLKRQRIQSKTPDKLNSDKEIMDYYCKVNKKCSVRQTNLETIFEEPKESSDGDVITMSGAKVRRSLIFSGRLSKAKKAKRVAKVKKFTKKIGEKKRKLTIDEVKLRLAESLDSWSTLFESD